ncbi:hypothetical protein HELRODRAFT_162576 [Helobdella robusta]|uniref:Uncharacterized protein n=1 Tax=Helobdella robusta TaxID=6412 RepID=T1ESV1_HELRO|nr:hypothetical protein HELRODRAFT_162576 [Helobdella robusta]ESN99089.1 hypothetical protein HELRODRAFT_162576 [Helobdella robusta]
MEESVHCDFSDNPVLEALTFNDFDCENFGNAAGDKVLGSDYRSSSERNLLCLLCDDDDTGNFLLDGTDPDDKEIREKLRNHKLQELLDIQKKERENDNFNKLCLFCNKCFSKSRIQYLNHLLENHNLNLGPIENIGINCLI